jgi:hypothetical protein
MPTRIFLGLALAVHLGYAAFPLSLLVTGTSGAALPAVAAVAPLLGLLWFAVRHGSRSHRWVAVSLGTAVVQSAGMMAAIVLALRPTELHAGVNLLVYFALLVPPALLAWLAQRATRTADSPHQTEFPTRAVRKSFWDNDSVVVTDEAVEIWVQRGATEPEQETPLHRLGKVPWKAIPLADITAVGVRAAVPDEPPWVVLHNGPSSSVPAGDVVVVRTDTEDQVLPVEDAATLARLIRTRTGRDLPFHAEQPEPERDAHVAEVLPAPDPVGPEVHAVRGPDEPLPTGPGLSVRWLVAAPVALAGVVGLPLVLLLTTGATWGFLAWTGVALVAWLANLRTPRVWGRVALLPVPLGLMWLVVHRQWLFALALVLCPVLGRLAGAVFTSWRGTDLGGSGVEVPFKLPNGERLHLQRNRLVRQPRGPGVVPYALWLADVTLAQCGVRSAAEVQTWHSPGGYGIAVQGSTWLRIVAGRQQWLMPTPEPRLIAELVKARKETAAPAPADDLDLAGWYRLREWVVAKTYGGLVQFGTTQKGIGWRLFVAAVAGGFAFMLLPLAPMRVPGLAVAVIALVALADWVRLRPGVRRAQHHSLPPGSPNWGEVRPDHAPVLGYQPWV